MYNCYYTGTVFITSNPTHVSNEAATEAAVLLSGFHEIL